MRRLLWVLLVVSAIALFALVVRPSEAIELIENSAFETRIMALALVLVIAVALFRQRLTHVLASAVIWALIVGLLLIGYAYRFELRDVGERVLAELLPGHAAGRGRTVELARANGGGFSVTAQINGVRVPMVLDTGASAVVLTNEAAKAVGLPLEVLTYSVSIETANGRARAAPVTLDRISIGSLTERSVPALIAQPGQLRTNLLGMSFLNRLESWEVRGDKLLLRGYP